MYTGFVFVFTALSEWFIFSCILSLVMLCAHQECLFLVAFLQLYVSYRLDFNDGVSSALFCLADENYMFFQH